MAKDYGTAYVPASGTTVSMRECDACGAVYASGAIGHEVGATPATATDWHKAHSTKASA